MKKILLFAAVLLAAVSCKNGTKTLLPNVSGKAGEIIVIMDKNNWDGDLGTAVRDVLAGDCPYLAQKEPLYNLANVSPTGFADLFKVHRNIMIFNLDATLAEGGMLYRADVWARPQCVVQLNARDAAEAARVFQDNEERILATFEQAERDRVIANSKLYEEKKLGEAVREMIGGSPHFPSGYKLKKKTDDFIWIADEKQYSTQGVFIYTYPASATENLSLDNIIAHRNRILKDNVPGMFEGTYMTTGDYLKPTVEYVAFRGRQFAQTRGFWEVHNDFMGGPFVSHAFYGKDPSTIVVLEAWVYAPKYDKRQYLRQVESIIYSFEWDKPVSEKGRDEKK